MTVFVFLTGFVAGGALFGATAFYLGKKTIREKEKALDAEIKNYHRYATQFSNFLNYNGSSSGQEDVD